MRGNSATLKKELLGVRAGFLYLTLERVDSWNDVCSGISSEVSFQVEIFKPLTTDRSAQSCPQSWCLFFFFLPAHRPFSRPDLLYTCPASVLL